MDVFMGCRAHAQRRRQRGVGHAAFYASTSTFLPWSSSTRAAAAMIIATKSICPENWVENSTKHSPYFEPDLQFMLWLVFVFMMMGVLIFSTTCGACQRRECPGLKMKLLTAWIKSALFRSSLCLAHTINSYWITAYLKSFISLSLSSNCF